MKLYKSLKCDEQIYKMKLSPDESILSTLCGRNSLILWDTSDFRELRRFSFTNAVRDFAFAPDLSKMAVITADEQLGQSSPVTSALYIYDTVLQVLETERSLADVRSVVFLSSPHSIALGRLGRGNENDPLNYIDFVDLSFSAADESITLPMYEIPFDLATLPGLNQLVSLGIGLAVWDLATKTLLQHIHCDNLKVNWDIWETTCYCISGQHNQVAVGFVSFDSKKIGYKICLFDADLWKEPKWFMNDQLYAKSIALSSDGKWLAAALSDSKTARVWDTENGTLIGECTADKMTTVAFSPDNHYLITGANAPQAVSLWEI